MCTKVGLTGGLHSPEERRRSADISESADDPAANDVCGHTKRTNHNKASLQFHQRAVSRRQHEESPPVSSPWTFDVKTLRQKVTSSQWARARRVPGSRSSLGQQNKNQDQDYKLYQNSDQDQDQYQNQDQDIEQKQSNHSGGTSTH